MSNTQTQTTATNARNATPTFGIGAITLLKSPFATLIVLCSALLAQLPHAADVFRLIVMGDGLWPTLHSYTYAVALELAVLLFVVQRRNVESYLFAVVSIMVNLSYYYLHGVALLSIAALPAWLVSIALPAAIAQYSHLIAAATDGHDAKPEPDHAARWWHRLMFWRKPTETPAAQPTSNTTTSAPIAPPSESGGHSEGAAQTSTPEQARDGSKSKVSPETKAIILRSISNGAKVADVATEFDVSPNTVRSWIARTAKQTNGVH